MTCQDHCRPRRAPRFLGFEALNQRVLFAADLNMEPVSENPVTADSVMSAFAWQQNRSNRFDVNNDRRVSPLDALVLINQQNRVVVEPAQTDHYFADVDGDGEFSAADIETVFGYLTGADHVASKQPVTVEAEQVADVVAFDVDGSGTIDQDDAEKIRDFLAIEGATRLPDSSDAEADPRRPLDVNQDGSINSLDMLQVINYLGSRGV